jgi:prevent-host-death family protein
MIAKTMAAGEFKAKCLAVMDEVRDKCMSVTITKNGVAVAQLVPVHQEVDPIFGFFKDKMEIVGGITAPIYTGEEYEEFYKRKDAMYEPIKEKRSR